MPAANSDFKILIRTILWLLTTLIFYSIIRLEFLLWNWDSWFRNTDSASLTEAFLHGLRFDLSSITWLSSVVLFFALLPWPSVSMHLKEMTLKCVFLLINLPFLFLNTIDIEFIHFTGRRLTTHSYYLLAETQGKLLSLFTSYWALFSFNLILLFLYYYLIKNNFNLKHNPHHESYLNNSQKNGFSHFITACDFFFKKWFFRIPISILLLVLYIIFARGGFQPKPLELAHALSMNSDHRLTHLALNSSFTVIHSIQKKPLRPAHYFSSDEEYSHLLNANTPGTALLPWTRKPKNVVILILESFGTEYTGLDHPKEFSFTPFLDSLKEKSIYFQNSFANGRRSIEALPSLLAGMPSLIDEPFLTSPFQSNTLPRLGTLLAEKGIETLFFHGGANGTMFFQEFTQRLGFSQYRGKNEYSKTSDQDDDKTWGIWDGPFFSFTSRELSQQQKPFLAVLFSLSSHHPFRVPDGYENKLPKGPLPIHQSIAYTDLMLSQFFKEASQTEWFSETLFILTADHTSKSYYEEYQSPLGSFRVPLLLFFPGADFSAEKNLVEIQEPVQHIDVFPTLLDLFSIPKDSTNKLGRSLLLTGPRKVTLYLDGQQLLVDRNQTLQESTKGDLHNPLHPLAPSWKAHRQYFINSLLDNRL